MAKIKKKFSFYDDIVKIFLEKTGLKDDREKNQTNRVIYINNVKPSNYKGEYPLKYSSNKIVTSKYTLFTFLPKNLFEQFRRLANFYFLCIIIIMFIHPNPPRNPFISSVPLLVVITVTAIKQAYEDMIRHRTDAEVNNQKVRIIRDGKMIEVARKEIICGDIIKVMADEAFPSDLLLLHSESSECYVTTANLDGETNLKIRTVPENVPLARNESDLASFQGVIKCDKPNTDLYEFKGKLEIDGVDYPLKNENVLLRGSTLKVSSVVYGCAIYTGKDTKLMLNSKFKSNKLSCVERSLNKFILFFLGLLALYILISVLGSIYYNELFIHHWYLRDLEPQFYFKQVYYYYGMEILFFITIFSNIIPISMYIQIETQRFLGTKFFEWDLEMYDPVTDQPAKANNSNLNEDLGQVDYLFSDKTGTLTENQMVFKQFSLEDKIYGYMDGFIYRLDTNKRPVPLDTNVMEQFFEILTLCHTVQLNEEARPRYQASSPDEFSFVQFTESVGISFEGDLKVFDHQQRVIRRVNYLGVLKEYELLNVLEFDSDRKRMSVIVRCLNSDKFLVLTKGAEDSIFSICTTGSIQETNAILRDFSQKGWRTLALAYKEITREQYELFRSNIRAAMNDINNRDERLIDAYKSIERGLSLIGSTAVEDRLQDGVAFTLESLRAAGIKVWVLTGDNRETAINISNSCKHFSEQMEKLQLTDVTGVDDIKKTFKIHNKRMENSAEHKQFAYIIDGKTLKHVFGNGLESHFRDLCMKCEAVLCCRMSPAQKAQVVQLVKKSPSQPYTCAIGDGANDVSMIQEAHVGLGIFGKEGRNAARSADFAFAKFKFIRRALLVHGYLYYTRITTLVHYFFYKNIALMSCQLYYGGLNAFSNQSVFPTVFLLFYNLFFTANPIMFFGLLEQKTEIKKLEEKPSYYRSIKNNNNLSLPQFFRWNVTGIWHSAIVFISTCFLTGITDQGKMVDGVEDFGSIIFLQIFFIVHLKLLLESHFINWLTVLANFNSFLAVIILAIIPSSFIIPFPVTEFTDGQNLYWVFYRILSLPSTWLCFGLTCLTALIPDICYKVIENMVYEFKQLSKRKFKEKLACYRDLPDNYEGQKRKRYDLRIKKEIQYTKRNGDKPSKHLYPKNSYATYKYQY